uniref:Bystin n=1 Tax=Tetradesmus obliquus TaxID=3088 RepID=A0A383VD46_TETOB|eukprot:jgi/Sobl393_1/6563/SZX62296.1
MGKKRQQRPDKHKQDLGAQIEDPESYGVRTKPRAEKRRKRDEDDEEAVPQDVSARILREARAQQEELDAEDGAAATAAGPTQIPANAIAAALQQLHDSDSEPGEDWDGMTEAGSVWGGDDADDISPEDEAALAAFMSPAALQGAGAAGQRTLADAIMARLQQQQQPGSAAAGGMEQQQQQQQQQQPAEFGAGGLEGLDEAVVEVYRGVGQLLARYTNGKVPKAFKIIPNLLNWEEVLQLTDPEHWSPHAMYVATKMFVSNLNARMAQRFLALVLLPRVRRDIAQHRRLHFALFQALKKATYKAGAFYKGLLLPLCASRTCSLREAVIFSSVLRRASLPVLHSAAALLRLAGLEYCGTTSFFIRVLLDKKYALPYKVVDALSAHFLAFEGEARVMPVVWHQGLLCFVTRYKHQLTAADRDGLLRLTAKQHHHLVSPEVVRELEQAVPRDSKGAAAAAANGAAAAAVAGGRQRIAAESRVGQHVSEDVFNLPPVPMMDED